VRVAVEQPLRAHEVCRNARLTRSILPIGHARRAGRPRPAKPGPSTPWAELEGRPSAERFSPHTLRRACATHN
jgi:hypothetical protein